MNRKWYLNPRIKYKYIELWSKYLFNSMSLIEKGNPLIQIDQSNDKNYYADPISLMAQNIINSIENPKKREDLREIPFRYKYI